VRQFSQKGLRIDQLSVEAKLIYTGFGLFALAAILVSVLLYADMFDGGATDKVGRYYAGGDGTAAPTAPDDELAAGPAVELPDDELAAGPAIELPDDEPELAPAAPIIDRVGSRKLLEVTHFHLFTVPVFLLIISHLFMLCRLRPGTKRAVIVVATVATVLHLAAPWIIRSAGDGSAWLMPVSGFAMGAAMTLMTVWPCVAMWRRPPAKNRRNADAAA
jgi:hypothetical protein